MKLEDIFTITYADWEVTVSLAWDSSRSATTKHIDYCFFSGTAEAQAIGQLWQEYGTEIIEYIQQSSDDREEVERKQIG